jgi:hypothetical protein
MVDGFDSDDDGSAMKHKHYDLIGDIHGHHDKLTALLHKLGYLPHDGSFHHPEGRKVIFLGDYIDRGPKIRETLETVRTMVETGNALAILGMADAPPRGGAGPAREFNGTTSVLPRQIVMSLFAGMSSP